MYSLILTVSIFVTTHKSLVSIKEKYFFLRGVFSTWREVETFFTMNNIRKKYLTLPSINSVMYSQRIYLRKKTSDT